MAEEIRTDLDQRLHEATLVDSLIASPLSQKLQAIGQGMLGNGRLVEVQENVFSTCQEPIEKLADRLMRARDTGVPLVEATLFSHTDKYAAVRQLFGITSGLVRELMRSDGVGYQDDFWGNHIKYEGVHLPIALDCAVALGGHTGSEVQSSLSSGMYDPRRDSFSIGVAYEHDLAGGLVHSDRLGINGALERIAEDFEIAIMRDGSIEGSVIDEIPEERHIQAG